MKAIRRSIKVLLIIVGVLVVLVAAVAFFISPFAKYYIEKNSKELIGRQVYIKDLKLNIFTGTLSLNAVKMMEKNDKTVFASIDSFYTDVELLQLLKKDIVVARLDVIAPYAEILQNGDKFNFDDLMPKDSTKKDEKKSSFPNQIILRKILLDRGRLVYTDQQLSNTIRLKNLAVSIPELAFGGGRTHAGIQFKIGDASLASKLTMNMNSNAYKMDLRVRNLPLDIIKPYIADMYRLGELDGKADCDLVVSGNTEHIMNFLISGTFGVNKFNLTNSLGEPLISVSKANAAIDSISFNHSVYDFGKLVVSGAKMTYLLHPKTDNLTSFMLPENSAKKSSADTASTPMKFRIKDLRIENSLAEYQDETVHTPFKLQVSSISLTSKNFDMNHANEFIGKASFPKGGNIDIEWKGDFESLANTDLVISLRNFDLASLSPYCMEYTARNITKGNMNFISKNHIRSNNIISDNILDVYNINVDKKHKNLSFKPEYEKVPLKAALFVLKDKDGKIQFDIPVKGNISDPEFSYKRIVIKTIVNLLVKVAVSPIRFIASQLGLSGDRMATLPVDALQSDLTAEQYARLNEIADMSNKKNGMTLVLEQFIDWDKATKDYAILLDKRAFEMSQHPQAKNVMTYEESQRIKDNDEKFVAFRKTRPQMSADSLQVGINHFLSVRNTQVSNYLINTCKISASSFKIATASADSLKSYSSADKYKVEMNFPGKEEDE